MNFQRERESINNIINNQFQNYNKKYIYELFNIEANPSLDKKDIKLIDNFNGFPYFTRTEFNNGFLGYVKEIPNGYKILGNCIGVGLLQMKFFYIKNDFCAGQYTKTLRPKFKSNENILLFYLAFLNKNSNILKANLVRDFNNITNNFQIPNLVLEEINVLVSAIKKLVIKDLIEWYRNRLNCFYEITNKLR